MTNDNRALSRTLYDQALREIREEFMKKHPAAHPSNRASAGAIAQHAERSFHIMWQSALSTHASNQEVRETIIRMGLNGHEWNPCDKLIREILIGLMTSTGMSRATAEKIVDDHILTQ